MIQGIFYARFFPQEGPQIVAQSPPGCITTSSDTTLPPRPPLIDFDILREYIIPRQAFCNRYLTINSPDNKYAILGHPVVIPHAKYMRNEFIFNFGLILDVDVDQVPYERVVRRLATTFSEMEKQNEYLSQTEGRADESNGRRPIEGLLEIVKEDLNNYGECMIPVDEANTLNMKLFPHHPNPPVVKGWHVPVSKTKFADIMDPTWDLTLQKVISHIDGVSDVRRIAHAASVSLDLAKTALRHLLYYDTILLLDMFFFGACYASRPGIHDFVSNVDGMVEECAGYVSHAGRRPSNFHLIRLMTSFVPGKTVLEWLWAHHEAGFEVLRYIDVRRFVQFGLIKGCLYRVHKHVVSKQYLAGLATGQSRPVEGADPIQQYTDGCHHFDQIITEQDLTDEEIMNKLKTLPVPKGDLALFYR
ncbi:nitrogen permease regulator 2-domain-containing protein [Emericellopsis atlantica]|uniref:Nitrogen permease regulator 2-domain-containing protein n=1 Tax=Emericellopsis atlantica TaxID=2614577 RepID=A0A9P8CR73_9HYPO|nr:nitrogen permease regulator 2-domain-containing protein [Emericellopsis atlantica]KAG9255885.1 nitrogen permease regulator 2-domain-containing protein [Emericellopsis atlantica]